jgi:hypothetical protein
MQPGDFVRVTQGPFTGCTATLIATASFSTTHWWVQLTSTDQRVKIAEAEMMPEQRTSEWLGALVAGGRGE